MYDTTGDGWIMHFLHGTSQLLNHFGPDACSHGAGREFFLTMRIFEISRSLLFTSETFLSEDKWQHLIGRMWNDENTHDWHPKEALYSIMTSCSSLGVRGSNLLDILPQLSHQDQVLQLQSIATEGTILRESLRSWKETLTFWFLEHDMQITLALIYYSAASIYLSGLFDYFTHWKDRGIPTPTISGSEVQDHVRVILSMIAVALRETSLSPLLFLFPLRVVGSRARGSLERQCILDIFETVSRRGFLVASTFTVELEELWKERNWVDT